CARGDDYVNSGSDYYGLDSW
nr:immunoglobulin heavy chain junction region [Macaca mulatta]MOV54626.1 immunoglobulin heavy chain junction region [Macaca mulatta]MOV54853.1 immunoglobulin heavy chain junction region [Macaca mulatta]MOV56023.1 immunoglobulin heavy chain junction region [Macaca mulatta]MOV57259.1 immunoglobulin heavy chain junction region [Macaca mulatta]